MARTKLSDEVKGFIVQCLACFDPPSAVVKAVKSEFEVDISPQQAETYDPTKRAGRALSPKWRAIFEATRAEFISDTSRIGISHRAVRLRALQRMAEKAEGMGNMALAAQLHEQAAKEVGESYTNRSRLEHSGPNGSPMRIEEVTPRERIAGRLAGLSARSEKESDSSGPK